QRGEHALLDLVALAPVLHDLEVLVSVRVLDADEHSVHPSPPLILSRNGAGCKIFLQIFSPCWHYIIRSRRRKTLKFPVNSGDRHFETASNCRRWVRLNSDSAKNMLARGL